MQGGSTYTRRRLLARALIAVGIVVVGAAAVFGVIVLLDGDGRSDEDQVTRVVEAGLVGTNPSICTELATEQFLETIYGSDDPVSACQEQVGQRTADVVQVSRVEVEGEGALVQATAYGGDLDGKTLTARLVEEDEQWKFDSLVIAAPTEAPEAP